MPVYLGDGSWSASPWLEVGGKEVGGGSHPPGKGRREEGGTQTSAELLGTLMGHRGRSHPSPDDLPAVAGLIGYKEM